MQHPQVTPLGRRAPAQAFFSTNDVSPPAVRMLPIEVGDALNIYGERGPDPILPDDFDLEEYFRRYGL